MSYYSESLVKALGGARFTGAEDMDYGNWTPNAFRTIALLPDAIVVEYHKPINYGSIKTTTVNIQKVTAELGKNPQAYARLLTTITAKKNLGTLEELFIADQLNVDYSSFVQRYQQKNNRLRFVTEVRWQPGYTTNFISNLRELRKSDQDFNLVYSKFLAENNLALNVFSAEKESAPWYSSYQLVPQIYQADRKESPLAVHFQGIAQAYGVGGGSVDNGGKPLTENQQTALKLLSKAIAVDTKVEDELQGVAQLLRESESELPSLKAEEPIPGLSYLLEHHEVCSHSLKLLYYILGFADREDQETLPKRPRPNLVTQGIIKPKVQAVAGAAHKGVKRAGLTPESSPSGVVKQYLKLDEGGYQGTADTTKSKKEQTIQQIKDAITAHNGPDGLTLYLFVDHALEVLDDARPNLSKPQIRAIKSTLEGYPKLYKVSDIVGKDMPGFEAWGLTTNAKSPGIINHYQSVDIEALFTKLYHLVPPSFRVSSGDPVGPGGKLDIIKDFFITKKGKNPETLTWDSLPDILKNLS